MSKDLKKLNEVMYIIKVTLYSNVKSLHLKLQILLLEMFSCSKIQTIFK